QKIFIIFSDSAIRLIDSVVQRRRKALRKPLRGSPGKNFAAIYPRRTGRSGFLPPVFITFGGARIFRPETALPRNTFPADPQPPALHENTAGNDSDALPAAAPCVPGDRRGASR
ncbi:hypothetical protein, partial [Alistipes shahii]|uniref:hypothetical protein n=1 Tax=Alistipes shahii TaxID=328814 RepID=UPI003AF42A43